MNRIGLAIAAVVFGSAGGHAADVTVRPASAPIPSSPDAPGQRAWALQITPYLWASGLDGAISPFRAGPTIGVEKSFSDVLDELDFGGFINIWGRYDRFVFSGDIMYVSTSATETFGPLPPPVPVPPGTVVTGSLESQEFSATMQAGYRLVDAPSVTVDLLGGLRLWYVSNDVTVSALGLSATYGESFGWADPVIGARVFVPITEKLSFQAQGDVGGFGVGSDFTWSTLATFNYVLTDNFSMSAGYKVLDVDYASDGHVFDVRMEGPALGVTYRF